MSEYMPQIFYVAPEGLQIYPIPEAEESLAEVGGKSEQVQFKWYAKRKWWQFWKPTWYAVTCQGSTTQSSNGE